MNDDVSEERTIGERMAGLETQQNAIQKSLDEIKQSMADMARGLGAYMADSADFRARLLAVEQDLRDGRERFKAHDVAIQSIHSRCDQSEGLRDATKRHLEQAPEQEKQTDRAFFAASWSERSVWIIIAGVLALVAYLRG